MTVNGGRVDIFINEIFDQLCKAIQDKCSTLNIMNTTLATQISSLQTSTSTVVQQSIDNTNKQQATTTISSPQNCHVSVSRSCRAVSDTSLVTTKPQSIQQQQSIKGTALSMFKMVSHVINAMHGFITNVSASQKKLVVQGWQKLTIHLLYL